MVKETSLPSSEEDDSGNDSNKHKKRRLSYLDRLEMDNLRFSWFDEFEEKKLKQSYAFKGDIIHNNFNNTNNNNNLKQTRRQAAISAKKEFRKQAQIHSIDSDSESEDDNLYKRNNSLDNNINNNSFQTKRQAALSQLLNHDNEDKSDYIGRRRNSKNDIHRNSNGNSSINSNRNISNISSNSNCINSNNKPHTRRAAAISAKKEFTKQSQFFNQFSDSEDESYDDESDPVFKIGSKRLRNNYSFNDTVTIQNNIIPKRAAAINAASEFKKINKINKEIEDSDEDNNKNESDNSYESDDSYESDESQRDDIYEPESESEYDQEDQKDQKDGQESSQENVNKQEEINEEINEEYQFQDSDLDDDDSSDGQGLGVVEIKEIPKPIVKTTIIPKPPDIQVKKEVESYNIDYINIKCEIFNVSNKLCKEIHVKISKKTKFIKLKHSINKILGRELSEFTYNNCPLNLEMKPIDFDNMKRNENVIIKSRMHN